VSGLAGKTYWIIGASEGLGRALSFELAQAGARLVLSARTDARLAAVSEAVGGAKVVPLDVTDIHSVARAVAIAGRFDGIVYCAGRYEPMTATQWDADEAEAICDVNFMGAMRVLGRVVPDMVRRGSGHVVVIGSLSAHRGLPGAIGYGASKAALMNLAESILADTRGTGVKVQLANPGFIATRLTEKNKFRMPYMMTAEDAARHTAAFMRGRKFRTDFPFPFSALFTFGKFLPLSIFQRLFG